MIRIPNEYKETINFTNSFMSYKINLSSFQGSNLLSKFLTFTLWGLEIIFWFEIIWMNALFGHFKFLIRIVLECFWWINEFLNPTLNNCPLSYKLNLALIYHHLFDFDKSFIKTFETLEIWCVNNCEMSLYVIF